MTVAEILDDFPDLTAEDIQACFAFAADRERRLAVIRMKLLFDDNLSPKSDQQRCGHLKPQALSILNSQCSILWQ
jgi:hypothetical protein